MLIMAVQNTVPCMKIAYLVLFLCFVWAVYCTQNAHVALGGTRIKLYHLVAAVFV